MTRSLSIRRAAFLGVLSLTALSLASVAPAQVNRDDMTPLAIGYTLTVQEDLTTLRIDLDVAHLSGPRTRVAMPNWTPGAYGIGRYGERVKGLEVSGAGRALEVTRLDHQTWSIDTAGVDSMRLSYEVMPRRRGFRTRPADATKTGMRVSGPSTFVHVVGAKDQPITVRYVLPEGWRVANGLRPTEDPNVRLARTYDTFIDAPSTLGIFKQFDFEVAGTPFSCVFFQNQQRYDFDLEAFVEVCRKIVTYQGEMFGGFPFPNYVFLFSIPGGGGLEHLNSTTIGLNPGRMKEDVNDGASVTAHEFFHLWNVKRIRPKVLGPFEYQHENYTGNLWVSEGWTSYYGDLTMVRTGIISPDKLLSLFTRYIKREMNKEGRKQNSVYWASRNVWHRQQGELPRVDYYGKGEILGAAIDLKIRHVTGNHKSLDDVMRFLNRWFAERGVGFEEGDIERACTAISNHDFDEFFARHVYGTLDPPLQECFGYAGIEYTEEHELTTALPFSTRRSRRGWVVAANSGRTPRAGDVILTLDGEARDEPADYIAGKQPGDKVIVGLERGGEPVEIEVELTQRDAMTPHLRFADDPTELQRRIREGWLSGD